jgi:hypothetical protein
MAFSINRQIPDAEEPMIKRILNKLKRDGLVSFLVAIVRYPFHYQKRKVYKKILTLHNPKEKFSEIYKRNYWSSSESLSGKESEVFYTEPLSKWLISNIPRLNIKTFVDAACGDYNWMRFITPEVNINYIGLDIVDDLIARNRLQYGADNVDFRAANICEDRLPPCDMIMVRACLFHFSYADTNRFLINLAKTDYRYLLTTSYIVDNGFKNSNIITGEFRLIDLFSEPFNFDSKLVSERVIDYPEGFSIKREMILMEKQFVPTHLPM